MHGFCVQRCSVPEGVSQTHVSSARWDFVAKMFVSNRCGAENVID